MSRRRSTRSGIEFLFFMVFFLKLLSAVSAYKGFLLNGLVVLIDHAADAALFFVWEVHLLFTPIVIYSLIECFFMIAGMTWLRHPVEDFLQGAAVNFT